VFLISSFVSDRPRQDQDQCDWRGGSANNDPDHDHLSLAAVPLMIITIWFLIKLCASIHYRLFSLQCVNVSQYVVHNNSHGFLGSLTGPCKLYPRPSIGR
jgi:hypothetical protein